MASCTNVFFQPAKRMVVDPGQLGIEFEDIYFKSVDDLNLHGWWFPASGKSNALLLYMHGNGENISTHSAAVYWLTQHHFDVFIFDYRGYGLSQGVPDMDKSMTDIYQALKYVNSRNESSKKIFVMGQSLGASMGIYALAQKPAGVAGAIFVSPFSDYREITRDTLAGSWLTWALQWPLSLTISNDYRPMDYVKKLPAIPVLFLYSNEDRVIPARHVKQLYENSNQPKFIEQVVGTHSSILNIQTNQEVVLRYLNKWLE